MRPGHAAPIPGLVRHSRRSRVLGLFALVVLPLLLLAAFSAWRAAAAAEHRARNEREASVHAAAQAATAYVNENLGIAGVDNLFLGLISAYFVRLIGALTGADAANAAPPSDGAIGALFDGVSAPAVDAFVREALAAHPDWEDIGMYDRNGTPVGAAHRAEPVPDLANQPYVRRATGTNHAVLSPPVINALTGRPVVILALPVSLPTADTGVLTVALSTARLGERLRALYHERDVEIALVDGDGRVFVHSDGVTASGLPSWRDRAEVAAVLAGASGSRETRGQTGEGMLVAYAPVAAEDASWGLLVAQPAATVLGPARRERLASLTLVALAAAATAALAWYFAGSLARASVRQADALAGAERAGQVRDEFLASASHELRTPLAAIKGAASSLRQPDVTWDDATRAEFLADIEGESDRLAKMITDLLDVSRIESGGLDSAVRVPTAPAALVIEGAARVQGLLRDRALLIDVPEDLPLVPGDPALLARVVANLLENAAKYSPPGSAIRVGGRAVGGMVELWVEDAGAGIPPEHLERVFDKFFRVNGGGQSAIPGTGLGLTICRRIVEAHGGRIRAENLPEGGARFTVHLPAADPGAPA